MCQVIPSLEHTIFINAGRTLWACRCGQLQIVRLASFRVDRAWREWPPLVPVACVRPAQPSPNAPVCGPQRDAAKSSRVWQNPECPPTRPVPVQPAFAVTGRTGRTDTFSDEASNDLL